MRILARVVGWFGVIWQAYWLFTHPENGSLVPVGWLLAFAVLALVSGRLQPDLRFGSIVAVGGIATGAVGYQVVSRSSFGSTPLWAELAMILALPTAVVGMWLNRQPRRQQLIALGVYLGSLLFSAGIGAWVYTRPRVAPAQGNWVTISETLAAVSEPAQKEMFALIRANDRAGVQRMATEGRVLLLPTGTKLAMQSAGLASHRVTVLSGSFAGRTCLVSVEHVAHE